MPPPYRVSLSVPSFCGLGAPSRGRRVPPAHALHAACGVARKIKLADMPPRPAVAIAQP